MAAPTLPTLVPTAYSSYTGTAPTTTTVGNIDNTVAGADGLFVVLGANSTGKLFYTFPTLPSDFVKFLTFSYNLRYKIETLTNDTELLVVHIYGPDKTTLVAVGTTISKTASQTLTNTGSQTLTIGGSYINSGKAFWESCFITFQSDHTANMGNDGSVWSIDEVELNGTYEAAPTVALNSPADAATGVSTTPQLLFTGTDPNTSNNDLEYEVQVDTVNTFNSTGLAFQLKYVDLNLVKIASPTDNLTVEIRSDSFSGTLLATSNTVAASSVLASYSFIRFTFSAAVTITGKTKYYLVLTRSGSRDTTNYIAIASYSTSDNYTEGEGRSMDNGTWTDVSVDTNCDFDFKLFDESTVLKLSNIKSTGGYIGLYGASGILEKLGQSFTGLAQPVISKLSSVPDTGFLDNPDEGDTHPFTNATQIAYTVQSGNKLNNNTTYYWRVRAIDPSGSNTWGAWATARSFTTSSGFTPRIIFFTIPLFIALSISTMYELPEPNNVIDLNETEYELLN